MALPGIGTVGPTGGDIVARMRLGRVWVTPLEYRNLRGGAAPQTIPPTLGAYPTTSGTAPPPEAVVRAAARRYTGATVAHPAAPAGTGPASATAAPATPTTGPADKPPMRHVDIPFTRLHGAAVTAFAAARTEALRRVPWFGKAILQLRPVALPGYGTFGVTEGKVLIMDPLLILAWCYPRALTATVGNGAPVGSLGALDPGGVSVLANVLIHEAMHPFLGHAARFRAMPGYVPALHHRRANEAADIEIHSILFAAGCVDWPWEVCHAQGYGLPPNMPMEWYFTNLPPEAGKADGEAAPGAGDCGSGATGYGSEVEAEADRRFGASPEEAESERRAAAAGVASYAKAKPGTVPGGVLRHVEDMARPIAIPWPATVAARVSAAIDLARRGEVRTYLRPNRKQGGLGYGAGRAVLSASRAPTPRVWVAVDTSGSMGPDELTAGLGVVLGVIARAGATAVMVTFDAKVQTMTTVGPGDNGRRLAELLKGGGGSNVCPVFDAAADPPRGLPSPGVLIVFTDGYIAVPDAAPRGLAVVWVTGPTKDHPGADGRVHGTRPAPWGDHVVVDVADGRVLGHDAGAKGAVA